MMENKKRFQAYPLNEYPEVDSVEFPKKEMIAHAVCNHS